VVILRAAGLMALCASLASAQSTAERARDAFFRNQADSAFALFTNATRETPTDARLYAWLGEAALRARKPSDAARAVEESLRLDPCNAHAYFVRASLFMPRFAAPGQANDDSTWTYLNRSIACDPSDGNTWADMWKYAIIRRDTTMEARALRALIATGFLSKPQLTYAEWLLKSVPPRAVLLTSGDLDTYAPLAVQATRSVRRDVAVVNVVMLGAAWYSKPILERHQLRYDSGAVADSAPRSPERIIAWLRRQSASGALGRPVVFALTTPVDTDFPGDVLQLAGPYWVVMPPRSARTHPAKISASLRAAETFDWRGPATSATDRSPLRRVYALHPALVAAGIPLLEIAVAPSRADLITREREKWMTRFLTRAGVDPVSRDDMLQRLRAARRR
jgi:hypothetical protein